jgi:hypothetical protein
VSAPFFVKVIDLAGTVYATPTAVKVSQGPTWVKGGWGSLDFEISTVDADAEECIPLKREVQFWYDDGVTPKCIWWGRIVRREANGPFTTVQCLGLEWDLSGIQLGPILSNFLTDPDFENSSLTNWTATGATKTSETSIRRKGTRSMKLVSASEGLDQFAYQTFSFTAGAIATQIFVRARFYATASAWIGPALQERGLFVQRIESGTPQPEGASGQAGVWTPITNAGPFNQWVKIVAPPVSVPAGHTQTIEVRCYSPGGTIYWDTAIATKEESTGANSTSGYADLNTIIGNVLTYGQDTASNKTDYGIGNPAGSFGLSLSRQWQFYAHGNLWNDVLQPFIDAGTLDAWVEFDDAGTTKTLATATQKGTDRTGSITLTLGDNATLSSYSQDGQETAGAITVLSQGMAGEKTLGKDYAAVADVAYAVDVAANDGITREDIITAAPETTLDGIASQATTELARRKELVTVPTWNTPADVLIAAGVETGDRVLFDGGGYGWVGAAEVAQEREIVSMTLAPDKNLMSVTGN